MVVIPPIGILGYWAEKRRQEDARCPLCGSTDPKVRHAISPVVRSELTQYWKVCDNAAFHGEDK